MSALASVALVAGAACIAACTPIACALLFFAVQLVHSRVAAAPRAVRAKLEEPPPEVDLPRAVVGLVLWYLVACIAVSVQRELGWIAGCFAVAACVSLPFVDGDHRGARTTSLFTRETLHEPLTVAFLYGMLPLLCAVPLLVAGRGACLHCFLWGHLCWDSARAAALPNALGCALLVAAVVNSFDGFALLDDAPLLPTLVALPVGKGLYRLFRLNKAGFIFGLLISSLVSRAVRQLLGTVLSGALGAAAQAVVAFAAAAQRVDGPAGAVLGLALGQVPGSAGAAEVGLGVDAGAGAGAGVPLTAPPGGSGAVSHGLGASVAAALPPAAAASGSGAAPAGLMGSLPGLASAAGAVGTGAMAVATEGGPAHSSDYEAAEPGPLSAILGLRVPAYPR